MRLKGSHFPDLLQCIISKCGAMLAIVGIDSVLATRFAHRQVSLTHGCVIFAGRGLKIYAGPAVSWQTERP